MNQRQVAVDFSQVLGRRIAAHMQENGMRDWHGYTPARLASLDGHYGPREIVLLAFEYENFTKATVIY